MSKKKKSKGAVIRTLPIKPKDYILKVKNTLPIHETLLVKDADDSGVGQGLISRKRPNGDLVIGLFLVDKYCLGVKDAHYAIMDHERYAYFKEMIEERSNFQFQKVQPNILYSFVHGAIDFAKKAGFKPCEDYGIAGHLLDLRGTYKKDLEGLEFGHEGLHYFIEGPFDDTFTILRTLQENLGLGNYKVLLDGMEDPDDDDDMEDYENDEWGPDDIYDYEDDFYKDRDDKIPANLGFALAMLSELVFAKYQEETGMDLVTAYKHYRNLLLNFFFSQKGGFIADLLDQDIVEDEIVDFFFAYAELRIVVPNLWEDPIYTYLVSHAFLDNNALDYEWYMSSGNDKRMNLCGEIDSRLCFWDKASLDDPSKTYEIFEKFCQDEIPIESVHDVNFIMKYAKRYFEIFEPITKEEYLEYVNL